MIWILGADQGDWVVIATFRLLVAPLSIRMKLGNPELQLRSSQMHQKFVPGVGSRVDSPIGRNNIAAHLFSKVEKRGGRGGRERVTGNKKRCRRC